MPKIPFLGLLLDKKGFAEELLFEQLDNINTKDKILWVHFDYSTNQAQEWIRNKFDDPIISDALLAEETRPRTIIVKDSLLLALRGVNLEPNSKAENMISIRLFVSENFIISTSKRSLLSIGEIIENLRIGKGVKSSSEFILELTNRLIDKFDDVIEDIQDTVDYLEENIINMKSKEFRNDILNLRREIIIFKRYLSPQKDALVKLCNEKISWINEHQRVNIREVNDQLIMYIEELDTVRDKVILIQEELRNSLSEDLSSRMYTLSIISAIFLPLTFLTGLLGINVGGIPGASDDHAFYVFIFILFFVIFSQYLIFKKKKWI